MRSTAGYSVMKITAPVNKIIPFSNVDGPSNRMAIFFQGCPFNCRFCHNPETIHMCNDCGDCIKTCPVGALSLKEGKVTWNKDLCVNCDTCIKTCRHDASPKVTRMTADELMEKILEVSPYIQGITLSGGECTLQKEFIKELFPKVKALGLTTLLDSNGSLDFESNEDILEYCDGVMLDVKAYNKEFSDWLIRYPNDVVLKNLDHLLATGKLEEVRTLIFPDRDKENEATVRYVAETIKDRCRYKIIRYRQFGVREEYRKELGNFTTGEDYAMRYVELARSLGASKAILD
ncbi:MAG: YjjW family glycine radical enzyme activase [Erysipelotrichaceae bacterium]|nr:YjjW family glycine radical enzyme activase [Erysipelotrichaceae bacterium]